MSPAMESQILCLGVNHESATVDVRERLAVSEGELPGFCGAVAGLPGFGGAVVLSTCNRTEVYAAAPAGGSGAGLLAAHLTAVAGPGSGGEVPFYQHVGDAAARHLFAVASGLDSMVLGETEIFGQVKKAYAVAHAAGHTDKSLNKLFQHAFQVAKHVRTHSQITRGATSVGAAGVDLAEKIFGDLARCTVMVLGAGEMGQSVAKSLAARGVHGVIVSNRSYDRAVELAREMDGVAMHLDDGIANLARADIVISATSAPHSVLAREQVAPALRKRRGRPLFLIDIAVPRDIEPEVRDLSGAYLYDIDALMNIAEDGRARRRRQIEHCQSLIAEQMEKLGIGAPRGLGEGRGGGELSASI